MKKMSQKSISFINRASANPEALRMHDRDASICGQIGMDVHYRGASIIKQSKSDAMKHPGYMLSLNLWSLSNFF